MVFLAFFLISIHGAEFWHKLLLITGAPSMTIWNHIRLALGTGLNLRLDVNSGQYLARLQ